MIEGVDDKAKIRSWLYRWLADLEVREIENATYETNGKDEIIQIKFK